MAARSFVTTGRSIVAIGRNYVNHVKELNNKIPSEPFLFLKPTSSYLLNGGTIELPQNENCHHEVELGVIIGSKTRDVQARNAMDYVAGYSLAIDMTARHAQEAAKKAGLPWSASKGFDTFTPISSFLPKSEISDPHNLELYIDINSQTKQRGTTADMIFRIPRLIEHISSIMTLHEGDLILTGTPEGVGPVRNGDSVLAGLLDLSQNKKELARWEGKALDRKGGYAINKSQS